MNHPNVIKEESQHKAIELLTPHYLLTQYKPLSCPKNYCKKHGVKKYQNKKIIRQVS